MRLADRFQLELRVGVGGTASVYRASDSVHGDHAAVKVLHPSLRQEPEHLARFWAECTFLQELGPESGVPVFRGGSAPDDALAWFATDFAAGGSLTGRIASGITTEELVICGMEVCATLARLHGRGIVHRDVKPDNILFDADQAALLCDFGIARDPREQRTLAGDVMGTPSYMPPEQAVDAASVTPTSDLFALGVTLFAASTRRSGLELFYDRTRPDALACLPAGLREVVDRATRAAPEDRYPDADAMEWALADLL